MIPNSITTEGIISMRLVGRSNILWSAGDRRLLILRIRKGARGFIQEKARRRGVKGVRRRGLGEVLMITIKGPLIWQQGIDLTICLSDLTRPEQYPLRNPCIKILITPQDLINSIKKSIFSQTQKWELHQWNPMVQENLEDQTRRINRLKLVGQE